MTVEQIGGDHYQSEYQHWDWAIEIHLGYLESAATKYISRWRNKGGTEDLKKAVTYIEKLRESFNMGKRNRGLALSKDGNLVSLVHSATYRFITVNMINEKEGQLCYDIATWRTNESLGRIIDKINELIIYATEAARPPQDAGGGGSTQKASYAANRQAEPAGDGPTMDDARRTPIHQQGTEQSRPFGYEPDLDDLF